MVAPKTATPKPATLGINATDSATIIRHIQSGFPFSRLARFQKSTQLPWETISRITAIPQRTLSRRQSEGRLTPEESDRIWRAASIFDQAIALFEGDIPAARQWLQTPQPALGGEIPLHFASTSPGAQEVERLILRLEHGVFS